MSIRTHESYKLAKSLADALVKSKCVNPADHDMDCTKEVQVSKGEKKKWKNVALSFLLNLGGGVTNKSASVIIFKIITMIISSQNDIFPPIH